MECAGSEDMNTDVERKGLGTPATRADIIEKLVKNGLVKRERKRMIPTEDGVQLIMQLPDIIKSPKLTADWENALTLVAKGELSREKFMTDIESMVTRLIENYKNENWIRKEQREAEVLGKCPNCQAEVRVGKYGIYCTGKCGMNVSRYYSTPFTEEQVEKLLLGEQILLNDIPDKNGELQDIYLKPIGIEEYHYRKGKESKGGYQFKYEKYTRKEDK